MKRCIGPRSRAAARSWSLTVSQGCPAPVDLHAIGRGCQPRSPAGGVTPLKSSRRPFMPRKVKIILNPMADMGHAWQTARDLHALVEEYGNADWGGTVYPTHATKLASRAADDGFDMVVAMGGDGTVHEVVNGLMQVPADRRPILGVV